MTISPNLKFDLVAQNQSSKEVTVNQALITCESILNNDIMNFLSVPPTTKASGDLYVISRYQDSDSEWFGNKVGTMAYYYVSQWHFIEPKSGITMYVRNFGGHYVYNGHSWQPVSTPIVNLFTLKDDDSSVISPSIIGPNWNVTVNIHYQVPVKLIITKLDELSVSSIMFIGTDELGQNVEESVILEGNKSISSRYFTSITAMKATGNNTGRLAIGNTSNYVKISGSDALINMKSKVEIFIDSNRNFSNTLYVIRNGFRIDWQNVDVFHDSKTTLSGTKDVIEIYKVYSIEGDIIVN